MAAGVAYSDDGTCWETVLRFLQTPSPADYSFEFEFDPTRLEVFEEGQPFEENLLVDEYLFKQPTYFPRQIMYSTTPKLEWKLASPKVVEGKTDGKAMINPVGKTTIDPAKFLKLTEVEMVQCLRRWKQLTHDSVVHPVTIKEADVYALHPADLISASCSHYFYSATKYSCLKRPTRLRITENGCRWKQQGRIFPIRENGQTVAYKTYLSYVALKKSGSPSKNLPAPVDLHPSTSKDMACKRRDRKWSLWTMEEIGLAEDIQSERVLLRRGGKPRPFPVLCRIVCKRDGHGSARAGPLQARINCKKPPIRRVSQVADESKIHDSDTRAVVNTGLIRSEVNSDAAASASMGAQNILEDEIIRALIYELPYGKVRTASTV